MSIFDILGPVMVGPSSSHTAGAVRIGLIAKKLLEEKVAAASVEFYGSFAATYKGHGTDVAIAAGLMGMLPDDERIPRSLEIAKSENLKINFSTVELTDAHPNSVVIKLKGEQGRYLVIQASSIGGGRIMINKIDGIEVNFNAELPTLIVHNNDEVGHVAFVTNILSKNNINIAAMQLFRNERGGYAVMVLECDTEISSDIVKQIENEKGILKVTFVNNN